MAVFVASKAESPRAFPPAGLLQSIRINACCMESLARPGLAVLLACPSSVNPASEPSAFSVGRRVASASISRRAIPWRTLRLAGRAAAWTLTCTSYLPAVGSQRAECVTAPRNVSVRKNSSQKRCPLRRSICRCQRPTARADTLFRRRCQNSGLWVSAILRERRIGGLVLGITLRGHESGCCAACGCALPYRL